MCKRNDRHPREPTMVGMGLKTAWGGNFGLGWVGVHGGGDGCILIGSCLRRFDKKQMGIWLACHWQWIVVDLRVLGVLGNAIGSGYRNIWFMTSWVLCIILENSLIILDLCFHKPRRYSVLAFAFMRIICSILIFIIMLKKKKSFCDDDWTLLEILVLSCWEIKVAMAAFLRDHHQLVHHTLEWGFCCWLTIRRH